MRIFGWCLLALGALLIITGWSLDASISGGSFGRDVVNLHQLFVKLSLILVGGFCLPAGAVFAVSGPDGTISSSADAGLAPLPTIDLEQKRQEALAKKTAPVDAPPSHRDMPLLETCPNEHPMVLRTFELGQRQKRCLTCGYEGTLEPSR